MGCVEIIGKSQQVERVYFRIKNSRAEQWNEVTIKVCEIITYKNPVCVCVCIIMFMVDVHIHVFVDIYVHVRVYVLMYMYMYVGMC